MIIAENLSSIYLVEQESPIERGLQRIHHAVIKAIHTYMQMTRTETYEDTKQVINDALVAVMHTT